MKLFLKALEVIMNNRLKNDGIQITITGTKKRGEQND